MMPATKSIDDHGEIITAQELAAFLSIDKKTVYAAFKEGKIPGLRIGGVIRFSKKHLLAWMDGDETVLPKRKAKRR